MGQISDGFSSGFAFMCGPSLLNRDICFLERASARKLDFDVTYLALTLRLNLRPFKVIILISTMQFLQLDVKLFIIETTAVLSQKTVTLQFAISFSHVSNPAARAKSSRYSILGSSYLMNSVSQSPLIQLLLYRHPNPKVEEAEASE